MLWQHIMLCCGAVARCASYDAHLATAPQHIPTQHDMLPQHLVGEYELNCEYCNITLARNKAPWWWSDKIETCRSVLKCFEVFYVKLYVHSLVDKLKWLPIFFPAMCFINNVSSSVLVQTPQLRKFIVNLRRHKINLLLGLDHIQTPEKQTVQGI